MKFKKWQNLEYIANKVKFKEKLIIIKFLEFKKLTTIIIARSINIC